MSDMQLRLQVGTPFHPLPGGSAHYVAALQTKPGELDALAKADDDTWSTFTPLIQVVGPKSPKEQINAGNVTTWTGNIADAVGSHPIFLDVLRLRATHPVVTGGGVEMPVLERLYWSARKRSLTFVPVFRIEDTTTAYATMVAEAAECDGRGLALRVPIRTLAPPPGMTIASHLEAVMTNLRVGVETTDLLFDLGFIEPDTEIYADDVAGKLAPALSVGDWRSITLLGTSIPSMMSCIPEASVGSIARQEWKVWADLCALGLTRLPTFGDYAIQHPKPPQDGGGSPRANIRYTTSSSTVVARGRGPVYEDGPEQYIGLAQQITQLAEFRGAGYTWGDGVIAGCAAGQIDPGSQRMWRGAGTSHHLRFVTDQLRPLT